LDWERKEVKGMTNKRYIVYPQGALSWEEILETVDLLNHEGAKPQIVKHNGFWNVSAERGGK
jgi:hypothetical protein